jgi:predicted nucleic acid-binding protein
LKEAAFWDSSALVALCIDQVFSANAKELIEQYEAVAWWAAPIEVYSAFARLTRMGQIEEGGLAEAHRRLDKLRSQWQEIEPSDSLRAFAEELPNRYGLRAADALQLAAAWTWTMQRPANRPFLSGDQKLLEAARQMGFRAIAV